MNKGAPNKNIIDETKYSKSTFTLTFAIEILNMDVWHDCNEGWLDLGPYHQAMKLQYQLYPGKSFDLDILIWPHVVKIWCGYQYGYVRTWQFLERRWFTFSIRHAFVARVIHLKNHVATVTCAMGGGSLSNNAKNDKNIEAYLPPLKFGERRYFGQVLEKEEECFEFFIQNLLWNLIETYIPASCLDGLFDTPLNVTDKRHQDATIFNVQEMILTINESILENSSSNSEELIKSRKTRRDSKSKEKEKKKPIQTQKGKFTINLSGDAILAGTGRITPFNLSGDRPPDQGNIVALISSNNLPALDDFPIIFINIEKISNLPIDEFKCARLSQIYTQWTIDDETHESQKQNINIIKTIHVNDSYTIPLQSSKVAVITATFLDNPFEIQLRGLIFKNLTIIGKEKNPYSSTTGNTSYDYEDILIATTKIDLSSLSKMSNRVIRGEFPLFPPKVSVVYDRQSYCTNDVNAIKLKLKPTIVIKPSAILEAQTSLEVSIGLVGCKPKPLDKGYSRLYCQTFDSQISNAILSEITTVNENTSKEYKQDVLTGFLLDTKDVSFFYIEGPKDGKILEIFDITGIFHSQVLIYFPCSELYLDRIYPNMPFTKMKFNVFKTRASINRLLKCPQVYVQPALPIPARTALLKIGRLIATKFKVVPCKSEMPTNEELESFKLELCVPPRFDVT